MIDEVLGVMSVSQVCRHKNESKCSCNGLQ